jgi:hypothetical protein
MSTGINIAPSSDLTVGTTAVTSGTDTRVFFQAGGVVQQDANFTFDNTLKRLTLKAVGTAATDIPFIVRNSADTFDILACYGDETTIIGRNASTEPRLIINRAGSTKMVLGGTSNLNIQFPNSGFGQLNSGTQGWDIISSSGDIRTRNSSTSTILKGNFFGVGIANPAARLDVQAQGALSTDIAFRVRNSADTADLISFRGDGSQWIQSVPFIHAGTLTGGTNAAQSLYIGYNSRNIASTGSRNVIIGTGSGSTISTNDSVCIGHSASAFNTSIAIGSGATASANNYCVIGSESYPFTSMAIGTGGSVTAAANVQNMNLFVGGVASGFTLNTSAASKYFRLSAQNGSGTGEGAPIQFATAPSGASGFSSNADVVFMEVRGDGMGLNHYQLSTPRVPSASITDGYIQYSNDITAGNAAPHFRTEAGNIIKLYQQSSAGIATVGDLVTVLQNLGLLS